jgi:hypothetical protein
MFGERLRAILGDQTSSRSISAAVQARPSVPASTEQMYSRPSHGLDQFFAGTGELQGFPMLDLSGCSQANISFITQLGYRLYSDDTMRVLETSFGKGPGFLERQSDPELVDRFMSSTLDFPEYHFCGALLWDTLQFLTQPLLQDTVDQLYRILMPGAYLFAIFHANERCPDIPLYSFRISDGKSLVLGTRNERRPAHFFNNRAVEKLFHQFHSVKFFLTRDNLREIIVRR